MVNARVIPQVHIIQHENPAFSFVSEGVTDSTLLVSASQHFYHIVFLPSIQYFKIFICQINWILNKLMSTIYGIPTNGPDCFSRWSLPFLILTATISAIWHLEKLNNLPIVTLLCGQVRTKTCISDPKFWAQILWLDYSELNPQYNSINGILLFIFFREIGWEDKWFGQSYRTNRKQSWG